MTESPSDKPWDELEKLVDTADSAEVESYLDAMPPEDATRTISRMSEDDQTQLLTTLAPDAAADVLARLPEIQARELLDSLPAAAAAEILVEMPSAEQADLLSALREETAEAILRAMEPDEAEDVRELSQYESDVAGGLMVTELLAYPEDFTVSQVVDDLRKNADEYRDYEVQYAYVVSADRELLGVLRLRDLLLAPNSRPIGKIMIRQPLTVSDEAPLEELTRFFESNRFFGVSVVNEDKQLVGVVMRSGVEEAQGQRSDDAYLKSQGVMGEELRTMPVVTRSRKRLSWLSVNILLNVVAASVIAFYQETLSSVIALAVFLPIISDMSGCSGNQAVAVSMREMTLGILRPSELWRVWTKEILVGLINGVALGILIWLVAWVWQSNLWLGLVVGTALALNTVIAVCIGGGVPLLLKRLGRDPALASGPILTTITDMCGFFLVLTMASLVLGKLTP
jgi:magnesium transporter